MADNGNNSSNVATVAIVILVLVALALGVYGFSNGWFGGAGGAREIDVNIEAPGTN